MFEIAQSDVQELLDGWGLGDILRGHADPPTSDEHADALMAYFLARLSIQVRGLTSELQRATSAFNHRLDGVVRRYDGDWRVYHAAADRLQSDVEAIQRRHAGEDGTVPPLNAPQALRALARYIEESLDRAELEIPKDRP